MQNLLPHIGDVRVIHVRKSFLLTEFVFYGIITHSLLSWHNYTAEFCGNQYPNMSKRAYFTSSAYHLYVVTNIHQHHLRIQIHHHGGIAMYINRINEQKKIFGISNKTMSERSKLHLSEETISRFLSSKTHDSRISTLLDVCETVGMEPYEVFMDAQTAAAFKMFLETKISDIDNAAELEMLRAKTAAQEAEIALLKERIQHKDEIIAIHNYYNKIKSNE